jgi:hypothetical protein
MLPYLANEGQAVLDPKKTYTQLINREIYIQSGIDYNMGRPAAQVNFCPAGQNIIETQRHFQYHCPLAYLILVTGIVRQRATLIFFSDRWESYEKDVSAA